MADAVNTVPEDVNQDSWSADAHTVVDSTRPHAEATNGAASADDPLLPPGQDSEHASDYPLGDPSTLPANPAGRQEKQMKVLSCFFVLLPSWFLCSHNLRATHPRATTPFSFSFTVFPRCLSLSLLCYANKLF